MASHSAIATVLLALCSLAAGADVSASSSLRFDEEAAKKWPVSKVTALLKDMLKQLEKEAEEDEEIYDKIACWCETNDKGVDQAIKDGKEKISYITGRIDELGALAGKLTAELAFIDKKVVTITASLGTSTSIRLKQMAEFEEEEKGLLEAVEALKAAIVVMSKHHTKAGSSDPNAFLQVGAVRKVDLESDHQADNSANSRFARAAGVLRRQLRKHPDLLQGVLGPSKKRALAAFLDAPSDYFDAAPTFEEQSYQPKSGVIYGILLQMLETFKADLKDLQGGESAAAKAFEDNKVSLSVSVKDNSALYLRKELQVAEANEKLALFKIDLLDTKALLEADEKYLEMLKLKCQIADQEWEARQKMRAEEIEAVSKALAMLNSDEAHELFGRTFNPEFLQTGTAEAGQRQLQARASEFLKGVARKAGSPQLAALAMRVRLDAFTKVKQAISDMVARLQEQQKDEVKKKDFCVAEFHKNELDTQSKESDQADLLAHIEDLETTIGKLAADIKAIKVEIEGLQLQMEKAGKNRDDENVDFQQTAADQQATQKLLAAALKVLEGFYKQKAALLQHEAAQKAASLAKARSEPTAGTSGTSSTYGKKDAKLNKSAARDLSLLQLATHYYESESTSMAAPASGGPIGAATSGSSTTIIHEIHVVGAGEDKGPSGPPAPPGFKTYHKNPKSGGVLGLLRGLIADAKDMEEAAKRGEKEAQEAYESFVLETTEAIQAAQRSIVEKSEEKAKLEAELAETHEALESVNLELDNLHNLLLELHRDCNFLIKDFDASQSARDGEIEALKSALAILSGAKFEQFLATGH